MLPLNVSSGSYITSYSVMIPFWSMAGTGPQVTMMEVEEFTNAVTFTGELEGATVSMENVLLNGHWLQ